METAAKTAATSTSVKNTAIPRILTKESLERGSGTNEEEFLDICLKRNPRKRRAEPQKNVKNHSFATRARETEKGQLAVWGIWQVTPVRNELSSIGSQNESKKVRGGDGKL